MTDRGPSRRPSLPALPHSRGDDSWKDTAACKGLADATDDVFFPKVNQNHPGWQKIEAAKYEVARGICATCPHTGLNGPCFAEAREVDFLFGRWGMRAGMTPDERLKAGNRVPTHQTDSVALADGDWAANYRPKRSNRSRSPVPLEGRTHGIISTYNRGCGCDECYQVAAEYRARYRKTRIPPKPRDSDKPGTGFAAGRARHSSDHVRGARDETDPDATFARSTP